MKLTPERRDVKNTDVSWRARDFAMSASHTGNYGVFFPEDVELLGRVFRETLACATTSQSDDLLEGLIASEIIGLAKVGERDPHKLRSRILAKLGLPLAR